MRISEDSTSTHKTHFYFSCFPNTQIYYFLSLTNNISLFTTKPNKNISFVTIPRSRGLQSFPIIVCKIAQTRAPNYSLSNCCIAVNTAPNSHSFPLNPLS